MWVENTITIDGIVYTRVILPNKRKPMYTNDSLKIEYFYSVK